MNDVIDLLDDLLAEVKEIKNVLLQISKVLAERP